MATKPIYYNPLTSILRGETPKFKINNPLEFSSSFKPDFFNLGLKPLSEYNIPSAVDVINKKDKKLSPDIKRGLQGGLSMLGSLAGKALSGSKRTDNGVGSMLGSLGDVTGAAIPGWAGAGISAGLNLSGGLYNGAFGYEKNEGAIAELDSKLNSADSRVFSASNTNDLISQGNFSLIDSVDSGDLGEDGWFSNKIQNLEKDYNDKIQLANNQTLANYSAAAENLDRRNDRSMLANYTAYGGPLTMRYTGLMSPFGNQFAGGGNLHTNGGVFSNGLIQINKGGTHEENPNEGVPIGVDDQGVPNLVEEGETIFDDYVFSNRIKVPKAIRNKYKLRGKKDMTFADASKIIAKESEERPNDPISQRGLGALLAHLTQAQEVIRMQQEFAKQNKENNQEMNLFASGGNTEENTPEVSPFNADGSYNTSYAPWWSNDNYTSDYLTAVEGLTNAQLVDYFKKLYTWYNDSNNNNTGKYKAISDLYKKYPELKAETPVISDATFKKLIGAATDGKSGNMHTFIYEALPQQVAKAEDKKTDQKTGNKPIRVNMGVNADGTLVMLPDWYEGYDDEGMSWAERNSDWVQKLGQKTGRVVTKKDENGVDHTYEYFYYNPKDPGPNKEQQAQMEEAKKAASRVANLRYLAPAGAAIMGISDLAGWTNKADYSNADTILNKASSLKYNPIETGYLSDYLSYDPYDINYALTRLNAKNAAAERNIINQSAGNRATAMAGLLANSYNHINNIGDTLIKADDSNFSRRSSVLEYNNSIRQGNLDRAMKAAMSNQAAQQEVDKLGLTGLTQAMSMRDAVNAKRDATISKNISGFFNSLGAIGQEEYTRNMVMSNPALSYYMDRFGNVQYKQPMAIGGYLTIKNKNKYGRY